MAAPILILTSAFSCAVALSLAFYVLSRGKNGKKLPPGPQKVPVLGNLHQIPTSGAHHKFTEWARQYGGLFSLKFGSGTAVVVSSRRLVKLLFDKKSAKYSYRPHSYVSHDLITKGEHLLVMQYGDTWRTFRKLIHQYFMETMCEKEHIHLQNAEAVQMMRDFMVSPNDHMRHPKRFSNSIISSLVYGIRSKTFDNTATEGLYEIMEKWSKVMEAGATPPVDIFPILKLLPQSLFGNWVSRSEEVGNMMEELYANLLDRVIARRERANTTRKPCFLDKVLDSKERLTRSQLYFLGGVLLEGGSDTSSCLLLAFLQAMVKYPHVQKKAQAEIDAVIGEDRSPVWSDFGSLPYINMIVKETHRWRPVTPLSFPHAVLEGKICCVIPAGSTVFLNVWGLHNDEEVYFQPEHFVPERYENHRYLASDHAALGDYVKRDHYGYGAGRRFCPGVHVAERNLFLAVSKLLWAFSFQPKAGAAPIDTNPRTGYSEGFLQCAKPFQCEIKPRSEARKGTILTEFAAAEENVFCNYETY